MDAGTTFVLFILGIVGLVVPAVLSEESRITFQQPDSRKRANKINALKVARIIAWLALPIQLIVAWQGLWLIHSGYSFDLSGSDPSSLGRNTARGRGRGGFILLIIMFFPYLLIGGFGFLAYQTFTFANDELPKKLKRLEDHEKEIQSMSIEKRQQWTEEMRMREEEEIRAEEKKLEAQREKERRLKQAINTDPDWLDDPSKEGWLVCGSRIKRFYRAPNRSNDDWITEETGSAVKFNQPPVITKTLKLTKREARSDWKYYLKNFYVITTPKWK